jgi:hypothetical protein
MKNALTKHLPPTAIAPYAGRHLNIGIPLHQVPSYLVDFYDPTIYHTSDSKLQRYHTALRRQFYELKFSPNPILQEYYVDVIRQRVVSRAKSNGRKLEDCLNGVQKLVHAHADAHQSIVFFQFSITISRTGFISKIKRPFNLCFIYSRE